MTDLRCDTSPLAQSGSIRVNLPSFRGLRHRIASGFSLLLTWQGRISERHNLTTLDERLRQDAGISDADISQEVRKPFWQA